MRIWTPEANLEIVNSICKNTMVDRLGIEIIEIGDDYMKASMPVDHRTVQPMRLLHGGASVALAETLGSIASVVVINMEENDGAVGISINASHLKSVKEVSQVYGIVKPIKLGRSIHVWEIRIENPDGELCCISRLTTKVLSKKLK